MELSRPGRFSIRSWSSALHEAERARARAPLRLTPPRPRCHQPLRDWPPDERGSPSNAGATARPKVMNAHGSGQRNLTRLRPANDGCACLVASQPESAHWSRSPSMTTRCARSLDHASLPAGRTDRPQDRTSKGPQRLLSRPPAPLRSRTPRRPPPHTASSQATRGASEPSEPRGRARSRRRSRGTSCRSRR